MSVHSASHTQLRPQSPGDWAQQASSSSHIPERPTTGTTTHSSTRQPESQHDSQSRMDTDARSTDGSTRGGSTEPPSRQPSTLKKRNSLKRSGSLRRSGSRSRRSTVGEMDRDNPRSAFHSPVPSNGNPTEVLCNRFAGWRRILKDFIAYFKEVQLSYESRVKSTSRLFHTLNSAIEPEMFLRSGGILETNIVLKEYHKSAMLSSEQAKQIEVQIISSLTGLRNDLSGKIKEIKALSGDFKNNLDKEREATRRTVTQLADALLAVDANPALASGKNDPYIVKLSVLKQLRRQMTEENYLHRAYLNLENSGRELESIVVSEIQKSFESYMNILRMEGADLTDTAERLQSQTLNLPPDHEWTSFVERDPGFVDPRVAMRSVETVEYPGWNHPAALEVRAGILERKSKYLKSYTPGWYVLSPSHLHEFKTPDRNHDMTPVMSLYLPECSMGSHTLPNAGSHKFVVKGRQTGALHRGHSWVFRAESHDVMIGFFDDIKKLIELSGSERNAFVVSHQRQQPVIDGGITKESGSSGSDNGLENDEADEIPYSADRNALIGGSDPSLYEPRPEGGRFPSDIDIQRRRSIRSTTSGARSATSGASDQSLDAQYANPHSRLLLQNAANDNVGYGISDSAGANPSPFQRNPSTIQHTPETDFNVQTNTNNRAPHRDATEILTTNQHEHIAQERKAPSRNPTATYGSGVAPTEAGPDVFPAAGGTSMKQEWQSGGGHSSPTTRSENLELRLEAYEAHAASGVAGAGAYELYRQSQPVPGQLPQLDTVPRGDRGVEYMGAAYTPSQLEESEGRNSLTNSPFVPSAASTLITSTRPTKSYGALQTNAQDGEDSIPPTQRTNSNFTISDFHVPGGYPKQ